MVFSLFISAVMPDLKNTTPFPVQMTWFHFGRFHSSPFLRKNRMAFSVPAPGKRMPPTSSPPQQIHTRCVRNYNFTANSGVAHRITNDCDVYWLLLFIFKTNTSTHKYRTMHLCYGCNVNIFIEKHTFPFAVGLTDSKLTCISWTTTKCWWNEWRFFYHLAYL